MYKSILAALLVLCACQNAAFFHPTTARQSKQTKETIMNRNEVIAWVREAPFDNPIAMEKNPNFSYDNWLARGRAIPHGAQILIEILNIENLQHPSGDGMRVAYALGWIGRKGDRLATEALTRSLQSKDNALRIEAVSALGRLGDFFTVPILEKLLRNKEDDVNVRANACIALGRLGVHSSEAILREMLNDKEPFVALCARRALGMLGVEAPPSSK
jgi:HEAT repeat protein